MELATCCVQPQYKLRHDMDLQASLAVDRAKKNCFSCRALRTLVLVMMRDLDWRMGLTLRDDAADLFVYWRRT